MLNWLHHADATLTFPQTIAMRYYHLEPTPEKQPVAVDYASGSLRACACSTPTWTARWLVDDRFTIADICIGYALDLGPRARRDLRAQPAATDHGVPVAAARALRLPARATPSVGKPIQHGAERPRDTD
jgi:glutathione S-transferase